MRILTWQALLKLGLSRGGDGDLSLLCPPDFGTCHHPQVERWGGGVTVVYQNNIRLAEKRVWQQLGLR